MTKKGVLLYTLKSEIFYDFFIVREPRNLFIYNQRRTNMNISFWHYNKEVLKEMYKQFNINLLCTKQD